jgi:hypothetical protein
MGVLLYVIASAPRKSPDTWLPVLEILFLACLIPNVLVSTCCMFRMKKKVFVIYLHFLIGFVMLVLSWLIYIFADFKYTFPVF